MALMQEFLYIKSADKFTQVRFSEITCLVAEDKYVRIITKKQDFLIKQSLSCIEKFLPSDLFCRIHRSYIIAIAHTTAFNSSTAYLGEKQIPIAKQYKEALRNRVLSLCNESIQYPHVSNYDIVHLYKMGSSN